jgi:hypothetical protein
MGLAVGAILGAFINGARWEVKYDNLVIQQQQETISAKEREEKAVQDAISEWRKNNPPPAPIPVNHYIRVCPSVPEEGKLPGNTEQPSHGTASGSGLPTEIGIHSETYLDVAPIFAIGDSCNEMKAKIKGLQRYIGDNAK